MNKVHKELVKVTGDMTSSKERVKQHVLHPRNSNKKPYRFTLLSVVLTLCVAGFILVQLLEKEKTQTTTWFHETQLDHFERITQMMWPNQNKEFYKEEAYRSYERLVAAYYFAESLGITYTKDELETERKNFVEQMEMLQQSPKNKAFFRGVEPSKYVDVYMEPLLPMYLARTKLYAMYKEKYTTFYAYKGVADIEAIRYFQMNFAEQATAFQKENNIVDRSSTSGTSLVGTVAKVESNIFLFIEGIIPKDLDHMTEKQLKEKYEQADWYPVLADFPVEQGDYITLHSTETGSIEENGIVRKYGLLNDVEVLEPDVTVELDLQNEQEVAEFLQDMPWQTADYMRRPPDYSLQVEGVRIEIWKGYGGSLYLQKIGSGEIKLSSEKAEKLKELLSIEES